MGGCFTPFLKTRVRPQLVVVPIIPRYAFSRPESQTSARRRCLCRVIGVRRPQAERQRPKGGVAHRRNIRPWHSVATTLLERGMPIDQIQKFLGHAKLETTQVYAESTTEMIKESYRRALSE